MFLNECCKVKMTFHNGSILIRIAMYSHPIPTDLKTKFGFSESLAYFVRWAEVNDDNSKLIWSEGLCLPNEFILVVRTYLRKRRVAYSTKDNIKIAERSHWQGCFELIVLNFLIMHAFNTTLPLLCFTRKKTWFKVYYLLKYMGQLCFFTPYVGIFPYSPCLSYIEHTVIVDTRLGCTTT